MSKQRLLINGFGRIGRAIFRLAINNPNLEVYAINDKNLSFEEILYLAKYDSVYGKFQGSIQLLNSHLIVNGSPIKLKNAPNIASIDFVDSLDFVIMCTGDYSNIKEEIDSFSRFNCKVIFTSFIGGCSDIQDFVWGVHDPSQIQSQFISLNICDGIATIPVLKFLKSTCSISDISITTLHPYLGYQKLLDGKSGDRENIIMGRSAPNNIIPKRTSLQDITQSYFPEDNITCMSFRIPTSCVACAQLIIVTKEFIAANQIQKDLEIACDKVWKGIGFYSKDACVSTDFIQSPFSFSLDHNWITSIPNILRINLWYDNEWGYACRVIDTINVLSE